MVGSMVVLAAIGCAVGGSEREFTFDDAIGLTIELGSGDVVVESSADEVLYVTYDGGGLGKAARPDVYQEDGEVFVDARTLLGGADIEALAPAAVPLDIQVDRGDIDVELAASASVHACVGAGSVSIGVPAGEYRLDLDVGAGSISSEIVDRADAPYTLSVCAGAGSVDVHVHDPVFDD